MGERSDLEGREPFRDPLDAQEPIEPPFISEGPYDTDLGPVPTDEASMLPYRDVPGAYGTAGETGTPDDIEAQRARVEDTRAEMGDTIDAIQQKLNPSNLAQQAKEAVTDATVGKVQDAASTAADTVQQAASTATSAAQQAATSTAETAKGMGSTMAETIKQNPMPVALIGIGLGWLIVSGRKQSGTQQSGRTSYPPYPGTYPPPTTPQQSVTGTVGQTVNQVQDTASQAAQQAQAAAQQAVTQVQNQASQLSTQAQQQARQAVSGFQQVMQQNPLAVGAIGVAVGAAIGLAIPESQQENQLLGPAREDLIEKAQETAQKAGSVAEKALGTAKEEAKKQGLSG